MSVSGVSSATQTSNTSDQTASRVTSKTLNQDDFLKLLVTQLSSQDPLNPMKDTDFIAQMSQFSALEQSKTMATQLTKMSQEQQLTQANALLGRGVELQVDKDTTATGVVSEIKIDSGTPKIVVNGKEYTLDQVVAVKPNLEQTTEAVSSAQQLTQAYSLLGRGVEVETASNTFELGTVSSIKMEAGTPKIVVNGQEYDMSQLHSVSSSGWQQNIQ